ncbi:uncharacterized protein LY89DRAFT_185143 [Mollisia scopiformis]|uniref:Uncharacterized protein n=1 Tax=Mollisia scopiformis TaxID=149040 RepID=A0A194XTK3_MOLSC|nr:uncharacterized protein LY89DRAFT_185143 [Mollisia scopiformis]KUJ23538.1 hypothetical protein LY89DRAFT_185143 [Mollisia scopiformis]
MLLIEASSDVEVEVVGSVSRAPSIYSAHYRWLHLSHQPSSAFCLKTAQQRDPAPRTEGSSVPPPSTPAETRCTITKAAACEGQSKQLQYHISIHRNHNSFGAASQHQQQRHPLPSAHFSTRPVRYSRPSSHIKTERKCSHQIADTSSQPPRRIPNNPCALQIFGRRQVRNRTFCLSGRPKPSPTPQFSSSPLSPQEVKSHCTAPPLSTAELPPQKSKPSPSFALPQPPLIFPCSYSPVLLNLFFFLSSRTRTAALTLPDQSLIPLFVIQVSRNIFLS